LTGGLALTQGAQYIRHPQTPRDGDRRPFLPVRGAFRVIYGPQERLRATIAGPRGVRVGWKRAARRREPPWPRSDGSACAPSPSVRLAAKRAEEFATDGPVDTVPGSVQRGVFGGSAGLTDPRYGGSASLPLVGTKGLARGGCRPPLRSPWKSHAPEASRIADDGCAAMADRLFADRRRDGRHKGRGTRLPRQPLPSGAPRRRRETLGVVGGRRPLSASPIGCMWRRLA